MLKALPNAIIWKNIFILFGKFYVVYTSQDIHSL